MWVGDDSNRVVHRRLALRIVGLEHWSRPEPFGTPLLAASPVARTAPLLDGGDYELGGGIWKMTRAY